MLPGLMSSVTGKGSCQLREVGFIYLTKCLQGTTVGDKVVGLWDG